MSVSGLRGEFALIGMAESAVGIVPDKSPRELCVQVTLDAIKDSGLTLAYLRRVLGDRKPASLEICALLVREGAEDSGAKYSGFPIPPDFVVGYGLDVAEHYRELDAIRVFEPA